MIRRAVSVGIGMYMMSPKGEEGVNPLRPTLVSLAMEDRTKTIMKRMIEGEEGYTPMIHKVVLTGGPCAGKSTALTLLSDRMSSLGFNFYLVPEAATLLFTGGGRFEHWDVIKEVAFESNKIQVQIALENAFMDIAKKANKPSIVVCDRGTMDSKAYVSSDVWEIILEENGWTEAYLRDKRYDTVIHLMTTAIGAEEFYSSATNHTRLETISEARELDVRVLDAWVGHPRLYVVDNSTDFQGKMQRVESIVCRQVGQPSPSDKFRKYLIDPLERESYVMNGLKVEHFGIEQVYLTSDDPNGYSFIQKRTGRSGMTYVMSVNCSLPSGEKAVIQKQINSLVYNRLLAQRDPERDTLRKEVSCFTWKGQYFEVNHYLHGEQPFTLLKIDTVHHRLGEDEVAIPPFIRVRNEVTGKPDYSSYAIARTFQHANSPLYE